MKVELHHFLNQVIMIVFFLFFQKIDSPLKFQVRTVIT